jgi:hypothetical protein
MGRPINQQEEHTMYIKKPFVPLLKLDIQFFAENKKDEAVDLKTLQTEFNASWKSLKGLLDQQADEMRTHGETAQSTADSITAIEQKINQYEQELKGVTDKYKDIWWRRACEKRRRLTN